MIVLVGPFSIKCWNHLVFVMTRSSGKKNASLNYFFVLVNGSPSRSLNPSHGIHQGDLMAPLLCITGISLSIWNIKGISIEIDIDPMSHLQFVDDTLLVGQPLVRKVMDFMTILYLFMKYFGDIINHYKSHILFCDTPFSFQWNISKLGFQKGLLSLQVPGDCSLGKIP
jgi:hypothetical protein